MRAWAALRVMPPDGLPIYDESERFPGAFTANCHSGVTLAGAHANLFAPMVASGALDPMHGAVLGQALRCSGCGLTRLRPRWRSVRSRSRAAPMRVPQGASAAAAVLLAGLPSIRDTPVGGGERAPYCMMGVCFDCLAEIDGVPNRQSCMVAGPTRHAHPPPARPAPSRAVVMTADLAIADLAIVGAGPAGMAAAVLAGELGLDTVLVDEQASPGGQIYRAIERAGRGRSAKLAARRRLSRGPPARRALRASRVRYRPATTVWHIDPGGEGGGVTVSVAGDDGSETIAARRILLATGAIERPVPIPGWTLPGVMTAGAAQILLKTADLVPAGRTVIAGQGPLLYLAAIQQRRPRRNGEHDTATQSIGSYQSALLPRTGRTHDNRPREPMQPGIWLVGLLPPDERCNCRKTPRCAARCANDGEWDEAAMPLGQSARPTAPRPDRRLFIRGCARRPCRPAFSLPARVARDSLNAVELDNSTRGISAVKQDPVDRGRW